MRTITLHGKSFNLEGTMPTVGSKIPDATLVGQDMKEIPLSSFKGKMQVIISVPSLDTQTCQLETKRFHKELAARSDLNVIVVSMDLPFAQKRWCGSEGIDRLHVLSDYRTHQFGKVFGVRIKELGLLARVIFIVKSDGTLSYVQVVPEVSQEPDYQAVLEQLMALPKSK